MYSIINIANEQNVKNTMIDTLLSYIAPHYCCGCGTIGSLLCDNCKYDITSEDFSTCIVCGDLANRFGICNSCSVPYTRAWCIGERSGVLQRLIGTYKFQNAQSGYKILGDLLLDRLEVLPEETIVVPIPTVASHIRQRGYDHTLLIAKYFARKRGYKMEKTLERLTSTKQRQATKAQRVMQAKAAFGLSRGIIPDVPYLLIDDVVTTGATLQYAAKILKDHGAREVWVAAIARQPLD
jgi:ComF family protein